MQRLEEEKMSQEFVIQQLLEQQKQFQKRHKNIVAKMKQYKAQAKSGGSAVADTSVDGEGNMNNNNNNNNNNQNQSENITIVIDFQQMYLDYYNNAQAMIDNPDIIKFVEICLKDIQNDQYTQRNQNKYERKEDFDELDENLDDLNINSKMGMLQIIQQLLKLRNDMKLKVNAKEKEMEKLVQNHAKVCFIITCVFEWVSGQQRMLFYFLLLFDVISGYPR